MCRFERIDRAIDEQVYLQICTTILHCIICPAGKQLSDSAVWLCVKTCFDISISDSLSDIVCRFAEDVLMQMVLSVFSHVRARCPHRCAWSTRVCTDAGALNSGQP